MYSLSLHREDDDDDSDEEEDNKTLADYVDDATSQHQPAPGSVLEVLIPMPFSINVCPDISQHHSDTLRKRNISMHPGKMLL